MVSKETCSPILGVWDWPVSTFFFTASYLIDLHERQSIDLKKMARSH